MNAYEKELAECREQFQHRLAAIRAAHQLLNWAEHRGNLWSLNTNWWGKDFRGRAVRVQFSGGWMAYSQKLWARVTLDLKLGENDSLRNGNLGQILDRVVFEDHFGDEPKCEDDAKYDKTRSWTFKLLPTSPLHPKIDVDLELMVTAHVESSNHCRYVGTGKFEEIMELKCGEA